MIVGLGKDIIFCEIIYKVSENFLVYILYLKLEFCQVFIVLEFLSLCPNSLGTTFWTKYMVYSYRNKNFIAVLGYTSSYGNMFDPSPVDPVKG